MLLVYCFVYCLSDFLPYSITVNNIIIPKNILRFLFKWHYFTIFWLFLGHFFHGDNIINVHSRLDHAFLHLSVPNVCVQVPIVVLKASRLNVYVKVSAGQHLHIVYNIRRKPSELPKMNKYVFIVT